MSSHEDGRGHRPMADVVRETRMADAAGPDWGNRLRRLERRIVALEAEVARLARQGGPDGE